MLRAHGTKHQVAGSLRHVGPIPPHPPTLAADLISSRLGIYTSSTIRTVATVKALIEKEAGCPLFEPQLILSRNHTQPAPAHHVEVSHCQDILQTEKKDLQVMAPAVAKQLETCMA
jgi:hypothetical protein